MYSLRSVEIFVYSDGQQKHTFQFIFLKKTKQHYDFRLSSFRHSSFQVLGNISNRPDEQPNEWIVLVFKRLIAAIESSCNLRYYKGRPYRGFCPFGHHYRDVCVGLYLQT